MSERTVSVAEAKAHLSELLASGEEVTITKRGVPIAKIVPHARPRRKTDLDSLREVTAGMPMGEDSLGLIRQLRAGAVVDGAGRPPRRRGSGAGLEQPAGAPGG